MGETRRRRQPARPPTLSHPYTPVAAPRPAPTWRAAPAAPGASCASHTPRPGSRTRARRGPPRIQTPPAPHPPAAGRRQSAPRRARTPPGLHTAPMARHARAPRPDVGPSASHQPRQCTQAAGSRGAACPARPQPAPTLQEDAGPAGADHQPLARQPHRLHGADGGGARLAGGQEDGDPSRHRRLDGSHRGGQHPAAAVQQRAVLRGQAREEAPGRLWQVQEAGTREALLKTYVKARPGEARRGKARHAKAMACALCK